MVIFALTKDGYEEIADMIQSAEFSVWVNKGVLTDEEMNNLRRAGVSLTNFTNYIAPTKLNAILEALETIGEHHPGERVWVELTDAKKLYSQLMNLHTDIAKESETKLC